MADTAALVVALSAQLTKFEKDMRAAGIMADKAVNDIENKFSKMNPQIKTSFLGNLLANFAGQALKGAVDGVKELVDRFSELQKTSEYAEVSMQWLYGIQAVGAKAGASFEEINIAVKSLAFQLDEVKRGGDNALKTLLEANPKFLKGVKVDALDAAGALKIVSDIMANMSKLRAVDVAKNLGLPEGTVETWRQGGAAIEDAISKAAAKAPDLARLAEQSKALKKVWSDFLDSLQTGIIDNFFGAFKTAVAGIIAVLERFSNTQEGETMMGRWADQALDKWREVGKEIDAVEGRARVRINKPDSAVDPFARKTGGGDTADDFDRATKSIEKHTTAMQAEAATIGESAHAQEEYRVQLALSEALVNSGKEINEQYANSIATIAERAATAKQALAEAQFQMARINQAGQVLGSAISTAFADAIVEGKKLDEVLKSLVNTLLKASINATIMSLFTPGAGGTTSPFASLFRAGGGPVTAGQSYIVGEQGPELFRPQSAGTVIPNDVLRQGGSQGGAIVYSPAIDARGASVEAVARLAQIMEQDRATFATRTVATIQQARRARIAGV